MKKPTRPKLVLAKDTIALLTDAPMANVVGGRPNPTISCWRLSCVGTSC